MRKLRTFFKSEKLASKRSSFYFQSGVETSPSLSGVFRFFTRLKSNHTFNPDIELRAGANRFFQKSEMGAQAFVVLPPIKRSDFPTVIESVHVIPAQTKPNIQHRQDMRSEKPSAFVESELLASKRSSPCRQSGLATSLPLSTALRFYSVKTSPTYYEKTLRAETSTSAERDLLVSKRSPPYRQSGLYFSIVLSKTN